MICAGDSSTQNFFKLKLALYVYVQVSLLTDDNKVLVRKLQQMKDTSIASKVTSGEFYPKDDFTIATRAKECVKEQTEFSASSFEVGDLFSFPLESAIPFEILVQYFF